jgi:hypothetical protein
VLIGYVDWKEYLNYKFYTINLIIAYWKQQLCFDYYKEMQLSYHVVRQHLFRPLDKKFVLFNCCSISIGQTLKQRRYKCCFHVYLTIFPDHDMLIGNITLCRHRNETIIPSEPTVIIIHFGNAWL